MNQPTISVIIPVYNAETYLKEAIDSITRQTFSDIEIIVIDDGSTDTSARVIKEIKDPRVIKIFHEKNQGRCIVLNEGIHMARGVFIARLDADDIAEPTRFENAIETFNKKPESLGVFGRVARIGPDGTLFGSYKTKNQQPFEEWSFARHGMIIHGAALFRKNALLEEREIFRQSTWPCDDLDLNLRLSRRGLLTVTDKPALQYRIHPNAETFKTFSKMRFMTRYLLTFDELERKSKETITLTPETYQQIFESSTLRNVINFTQDYGQLSFRKAGLAFALRSYIKGYTYLLIGIILNPSFSLDRLRRLSKDIL